MGEHHLPWPEIARTYPNEWVLLDRYTTDRKSGNVAGGHVVLHAPTRDEFESQLDTALTGVGDCAVLYTGKPSLDENWMLNQ